MGLASLGLVVNFLLKLINEDKLCPEVLFYNLREEMLKKILYKVEEFYLSKKTVIKSKNHIHRLKMIEKVFVLKNIIIFT
jgi:hypothetical protein